LQRRSGIIVASLANASLAILIEPLQKGAYPFKQPLPVLIEARLVNHAPNTERAATCIER
jgi:hypothetical protein